MESDSVSVKRRRRYRRARGLYDTDVAVTIAEEHRMEMLNLVATTMDLPEEGIDKGEEGTIVEILAPGVFLVEVCDDDGITLSTPVLKAAQLRVV